jgi:hypothetical protein
MANDDDPVADALKPGIVPLKQPAVEPRVSRQGEARNPLTGSQLQDANS